MGHVPDLRLGVHPDLLAKIDRVLAAMTIVGHPMRIVQGVRTAEAQHALWLQGRELPGRRVTNADGYQRKSNHQVKADGFGWAVDCCFTTGEPFGETQPWDLYGLLGKTVGLVWGGDWKKPDWDHLEMKNWKSYSEN